MSSAGVLGDQSATGLPDLAQWVQDIAELTKPDTIVWCDGSEAEWERLTSLLVANGTFTRLNPDLRPNSFYCASDPSDVARVEDRTFICSNNEIDAGPTNNWSAPEETYRKLRGWLEGSMRWRTKDVVPYIFGPLCFPIFRRTAHQRTLHSLTCLSLQLQQCLKASNRRD